MVHSYLAFIDESGDDGLAKFRQPGGSGGSSSWLVISALVFRQVHTLEAVKWRDEIANKTLSTKREIHFADMNHGQRIAAAQHLGNIPVRVISIMALKTKIPENVYTEKNKLYFYMTRYLVERISWLCRDQRPKVPEGDGKVAITFSRRGGMSYGDFQSYLDRLKNGDQADVNIHWPVIDIAAVKAEDHSRNASLQLADVATSSFAYAVEPDRYGNCEMRYAESLRPVTYRRNGNFLSYGVKLVPKPEQCGLNEQQTRFIRLYNENWQPPGP